MYIFIAICLFFSFICNVQANILSDMKEEYSENVQYCLENKFVVKEQFVFTVGTARVIENKAIAMSQARLDASSKIPLLRVYNVKCPLSEVPVLLQKKIKENYVNLFPCRYKLLHNRHSCFL